MTPNEKIGLAFMMIAILMILGSFQGIIYYHTIGGALRAEKEGTLLNPDALIYIAIFGFIVFFINVIFFIKSGKEN